MARSTYVYVITQYGQLYASFTVKYEAQNWAIRNIPQHLWSEYRVQRMPDGRTFVPGADNQFTLPQFMES